MTQGVLIRRKRVFQISHLLGDATCSGHGVNWLHVLCCDRLPCLPIRSQVCSFACASFWSELGGTVPLATAGDVTIAAWGGGGTAPAVRGVFGIEPPFRCSGGWPCGCGGGGREWAWWGTWGS